MSQNFTSHSSHYLRTLIIAMLVALIALFILVTPSAHAAGATCTWTADDGNMSNAANWSCTSGTVPGDGDNIVMDGTGASENVARLTNDLNPNPRFATVTSTANVLVVDAPLKVSGNVTSTGGSLNVYDDLDIASSTDVTLTISEQNGGMFLGDLTVAMGTNDLTFSGDENTYIFDLSSFSGVLGTFSVNNTFAYFTGATVSTFTASENVNITSGAIDCQQVACLGNSANDVNINGNGNFLSRVTATYANDFDLSGGRINSYQGSPTFSGTIQSFGSDDRLWSSGADSVLTISGTLDLNESVLTVNGESYQSNAKVVTTGNITGLGDFKVGTAGNYELTGGTSSFTGTFSVNADLDPEYPNSAHAYIAAATGFSPNATYIVNESGSIQTLATGTISSDFDLTGQGDDSEGFGAALSWTLQAAGSLTLSGDIEVNGERAKIMNATDANPLSLTGVISGDGDLNIYNIFDSNTTAIGGLSSENTFTGSLIQSGGRLTLGKAGAAPHDVIVEGSEFDERGFLVAGALPGTSAIGGSLDITEGDAEVNTDLTLTGLISESAESVLSMGYNATLTLDIDDTSTFNGAFFGGSDLEGDRTIEKVGPGTFISAGAAETAFDFAVRFNVLEGTAIFTNDINNQLNVFVEGGTLKGNGILGSLTQDEGRVAPGQSPGCLTSGGDVDFGAVNSSLDIELGGTTACTGYDQVVSDTDIDLNLTTLNVNLYGGFTPTVGDVFTIVRAPNIQETFSGLENGKSYKNGNYVYRINYNTGISGEDSVTLTVMPNDTPTSGALSATGANSNYPITLGLILFGLGSIIVCISGRRGSLVRTAES